MALISLTLLEVQQLDGSHRADAEHEYECSDNDDTFPPEAVLVIKVLVQKVLNGNHITRVVRNKTSHIAELQQTELFLSSCTRI